MRARLPVQRPLVPLDPRQHHQAQKLLGSCGSVHSARQRARSGTSQPGRLRHSSSPQLRSQLTEGCCNDAARPAVIRGRQRYFPDPGQLSSAVLVLQAVSRLVGGKECNRVEGYNYLRFCSSFGSEGRQMCMADMSASISAFRTKHQQRALVRSANQVLQRQASRASSRQPGAQPSS